MSGSKPVIHVPGVNVLGYLHLAQGLGAAARLLIHSLDARGIPVAPVALQTEEVRAFPQTEPFASVSPHDATFPVTIDCTGPGALAKHADALAELVTGRQVVGYWSWEVPGTVPESWMPGFDLVDEVWTYTDHVTTVLAEVSPVPVVTMGLPVVVPAAARRPRAQLELPEGFLFLFLFDHASSLGRKNPLGAIEAFRSAFTPEEGAVLVIKTLNAEMFPRQHERLCEAADRRDIHVRDAYLPAREKNALLASCDCYVSLHRSEGFGLPIAEAMFLGKPVIATAYGGNLDFMTPETSHLVPATTVEVRDGGAVYTEGQWGEPDLETAARLMREVAGNPDAAAKLGAAAAAAIRKTHSPSEVGGKVGMRLASLLMRAPRQRDSERSPPASLAAARRQLDSPLPPAGRGAARLALRQLILRLARPITARQRTIDAKILEVLEEGRSDAPTDAPFRAMILAQLRAHEQQLFHGSDALAEVARMDSQERQRFAPPDAPFMHEFDSTAGVVYGYRGGSPTPGGYLEFENLYRGPEDVIRERQTWYVPYFEERAPVLDAGCGRGEMLDLLNAAGVEASGVDLDPDMVARCHAKGHDQVVQGDLLEHLAGVPDASHGGIFCAQVIEHLEADEIDALLAHSLRVLRPDGVLILETINPYLWAWLRGFWMDLTHRRPVIPEVALTHCALAGFPRAFVTHPNGSNHVEADRFRLGDYAIIAHKS